MSPPLEIAANAVMTLSIVLAGRNNAHSWWLGVLGCSMFALLFYGVKLYADVALQLFFIVTCVIGWLRWRRGAGGVALPIGRVRAGPLAAMVLLGVAASAAYGLMLHRYTEAYAPFVDSAVLVFSIIAQLLLMGRRLESWPFWLLVNSISVPLYFSRGLHLTALLYAAYWLNAIVSWYFWRRQMAAPVAAPATSTAPAAPPRRAAGL
ncbi:nicotinamide riboside transporter PnuC [Rugamonas sp. CCM 8940]|uniref:nicotinamide riboside transporter PnuC n=1 Tax=Rugamonas sp. CCM 8940 TaxID=2765359 RepID=UPI0018F36179|nr:nicotinamide riboside transporter PnuC [Rugamonas sp. CCM 8940]MBJ7310388.1 nicotinamide mononucleotide transporter [Rugamonas sp. CCM 8940]